jgi:hypothetical protein
MKKGKAGFWLVVIVGTSAAAWFLGLNKVFAKSPTNNTINQKTLSELQNSVWDYMLQNNSALAPYKTNYLGSDAFNNMAMLTAWDAAIQAGASTYSYGGYTYSTSTGIAQ